MCSHFSTCGHALRYAVRHCPFPRCVHWSSCVCVREVPCCTACVRADARLGSQLVPPTRNSPKVSQPCGLKKTTSCAGSLFGPAVAWRTVTRVALALPIVSGHDFTSSLHFSIIAGDDSPGLGWTARSHHCPAALDRPGRLDFDKLPEAVRSTGLLETLSHFTRASGYVLPSTPCSRILWE